MLFFTYLFENPSLVMVVISKILFEYSRILYNDLTVSKILKKTHQIFLYWTLFTSHVFLTVNKELKNVWNEYIVPLIFLLSTIKFLIIDFI